MNAHALIPLIAAIAYIPLLVILLANQPWQKKQRFFFLFIIPAMLWSLSDFFFRSDFFIQDKLHLVRVVLCIMVWVLIQLHYFLHSFYHFQHIKAPFAYALPIGTVVLALLGYIPRGIEISTSGIHVDYGIWIIVIGLLFLFAIGTRDIYSLVRRHRISHDAAERNQIIYLLGAIAFLTVFILASTSTFGEKYPVAHIGNLAVACILTYAVMAHRLVDVRIVFRRGLMWLSSIIVGVIAYLGLYFLAHLALGFDIDYSVVAAATVTAIITAILIYRLQGIFSVRIEQALTGEKYRYRRELSDFITQVYSIPTLEQFGSGFLSLLSQSIDCQRACLFLVPNGDEVFEARFSYPPVENNSMAKLQLRHNSPVVTWLAREDKVLPVRNLSILPEFQSIWQEEREDIQSSGAEMFVSLKSMGKLVAILAISARRDGKLYTVEDIDLLESTASRVAVGMEKEFFHEQLQEQDKELNLINQLTTIITSNVSIEEIFEGFAEELKKVMDVDWASIALVEGEQLQFLALSSTVSSAWQTGDMIPVKGTATKWVCDRKKGLYEANLAQYSRFWPGKDHLKQGMHSVVYMPLIVKDGCIGSLILASRRINAYNPKQISLLERVALQIATPIENSQLYARAEQRARVDELTGLFNRRHFEERLKEELSRHSRYGDVFSLSLIDLDNFKTYNDIYGHPSGDRLLNQMGMIIKRSIRNADQAFRYGGDEFVVILPHTSMEDAYNVAERLRGQVAHEMDDQGIAVTCSIGLASYPSDGVITGELVTMADTALYYAKRTGGNRVYLPSAILSEPATEEGTYARGGSLSAVYALASAVDAKDHYTYGHSRKVNAYAVALAEAMGLAPDEVSRISTAALLHDIGKIGISDRILGKKGKLNNEDWEAIKAHPRLGANIVGNVPSLAPCVGAILHHHERWDGTGYPEGLKGENIPVEARIMAIADAFDAMTSDRPYRGAYPHERAVEELRKGAGTQFDAKLVEEFISVIQAGFPDKVKAGQGLPDEQASP